MGDELDDFELEESKAAATDSDWTGAGYAEAADSDKRALSLSMAKDALPPAKNFRIRSATYVSSAVTLESCPPAKLPEFAVIGRSNVGKSSLINLITSDSKLALVSKQPGKTKCINHFLINKSWYLVDLPGYGYAKRGRDDRLAWNKFTKEYFLKRPTLVMVMLLIDASIPPQQIDLECAAWMLESEVPFSIVFTKADKTKKKGPSASDNVAAFMGILKQELAELPDAFVTSSVEKKGRAPLLQYLSSLQHYYESTAKTDVGLGSLR